MIVYKKARLIDDCNFLSAYCHVPGFELLYRLDQTTLPPGNTKLFAFLKEEDARAWNYGDCLLKCHTNNTPQLASNCNLDALFTWEGILEWWKNPKWVNYTTSTPRGSVLCSDITVDEIVE